MVKKLALAVAVGAALTSTACAPDSPVQQFKVGQCVRLSQDLESQSEVGNLPVLSCDTEHDGEVYLVKKLEGHDYPTTMTTDADAACVAGFQGYVGSDYGASSLDYAALYPTQASWDQGDKDVVCMVVPTEGTLRASVKGSGL